MGDVRDKRPGRSPECLMEICRAPELIVPALMASCKEADEKGNAADSSDGPAAGAGKC